MKPRTVAHDARQQAQPPEQPADYQMQRCRHCLKVRHISVMEYYGGRWWCKGKCWPKRCIKRQ